MAEKEEIIGTIEALVTETAGGKLSVFAFNVKERGTGKLFGFKHVGISAQDLIIGHEVVAIQNESGKERYVLANVATKKNYYVSPAVFYQK